MSLAEQKLWVVSFCLLRLIRQLKINYFFVCLVWQTKRFQAMDGVGELYQVLGKGRLLSALAYLSLRVFLYLRKEK